MSWLHIFGAATAAGIAGYAQGQPGVRNKAPGCVPCQAAGYVYQTKQQVQSMMPKPAKKIAKRKAK